MKTLFPPKVPHETNVVSLDATFVKPHTINSIYCCSSTSWNLLQPTPAAAAVFEPQRRVPAGVQGLNHNTQH